MCGDNTINFRIEETNEEKGINGETGTITVKCIDSEGGHAVDKNREFRGLALGEYLYICPIVEGYDLVGSQSRRVVLTEDEKDKTIIIVYSRIVIMGTVTVKYVDCDSNKYIVPEKIYTGLSLGQYMYEAQPFKGYKVVGDKKVIVNLTEEEHHSVVIFLYKENL